MSKDGLCAIVTGSASGLGAATAAMLAKGGARIVVNYSNSKTEAEATADLCRKAGAEVLVVQGDVSRDDDCKKIAAAAGGWGRLDILVNNAGTTKIVDHADLEGLSAEDWHAIYGTNVVGAFQMIRACAPAMQRQGYGAIVNVSSIAGVFGIGSSVAYAASKGAMNTMTLDLARALAPEIRVNAVCPGFVGTRWFKDAKGIDYHNKMVEAQKRITPLGRAGMPDDIADSVVFLCAEGAQHITGELLISDAGLHLSVPPAPRRKAPDA